jgi:hypothetical protein
MKHAGDAALDRIEDLLTQIRSAGPLKEKSRGTFYLKSRAFLHFHEDPAGMYADVRTPGGADFDRIKVDDEAGAAELMNRVRSAVGPTGAN